MKKVMSIGLLSFALFATTFASEGEKTEKKETPACCAKKDAACCKKAADSKETPACCKSKKAANCDNAKKETPKK